MSDSIDYYFTSISPFVWLGHKALHDLARRHAKSIVYKPVNLADVWAESGAVPVPQRPPVRQRYRLIELQRIAHWRGLTMNHQPSCFPTNPELADLCCAALLLAGENPADFLARVGTALWSEDRQVADDSVLADLLSSAGYDADATLAAAREPAAVNLRNANSRDAVAADAIGAPTYVYAGEVFWGQDRLEYIEHMITSGRAAFT